MNIAHPPVIPVRCGAHSGADAPASLLTQALRICSIFVAALLLVVIAAPSAFAVTGYAPTGSFATTVGSGDGEVNAPRRVAVRASTGDVFTVDQGNDRVQVFSAEGGYRTQFGAGVVDDPVGIAIDQDSGDVYVSDNDDIVKFTTDGAPTPTFTQDVGYASPGVTGPLGFDQTANQLIVADTGAGEIRRYGTTGVPSTHFDGATSGTAFTALKDVAVQEDGDVLVVDGERIVRFAQDDSYQATFTGLPGTPAVVAAVPGTDDAIVGHRDTLGYSTVDFSPVAGELYRFTGDSYNGTFKYAGARVVPVGLAVSGADPHVLYAAADALFGFLGDVGIEVFEPFEIESPVVTDELAIPTSYGARLSAKVNPNRDQTTWTFEYGETTGYGHRFPAAPASIPAGTEPVAVSTTIGGLQPGTTYHYRIVATNGDGTVGNDRTFTTKPVAAPAEGDRGGRAYEQVTPVDKNGAVPSRSRETILTADGGAVAFSVGSALPGSPTSVLNGYAVARRGSDGWTTSSAEVAQSSPRQSADFTTSNTVRALSADLRRSLTTSIRALAPGAIDGGTNLYEKDVVSGALKLRFADPDPSLQEELSSIYGPVLGNAMSASDDLGRVLVRSSAALTPDAVPGVQNGFELADRAFASMKVGGAPPPSGVSSVWTSKDGRRVAYVLADGGYPFPGSLYLRDSDGTPVPLSASQRAGEEGQIANARFVGGADDGSAFVFSSDALLTDESDGGNAFYRYDVADGSLTDLTAALPSGVDVLDVTGVRAVSRDAATVYISVQDYSDPKGPQLIYALRKGDAHRVASANGAGMSSLKTSPNGRYATFSTPEQQTGFDPHAPGCASAGCTEVYVYDSVLDELRCASCDPASDVNRDSRIGGLRSGALFRYADLAVLDDGRVFFDSEENLVPGDTNGKSDVYEWGWDNNENRLITPGDRDAGAQFVNVTADGDSVFFVTPQQLVAQDRDDHDDIYVARKGGGIAAQNRAPDGGRGCVEDACQPPAGGAPVPPGIGSVTFVAGGNPPSSKAVPMAKVRVAKVTAVQGMSAGLKVTVPGKGVVRISGAGVARASRTTTTAGTYRVTLRLSKSSQRTLRLKHRVTVRATVQFVPAKGRASTVQVGVTFTNAKKKQHSSRAMRRVSVLSSGARKGR